MELKHKIKLQKHIKNIRQSRPSIDLRVWLGRRVSEVVSERSDHEKNQMDCWKQARNILKYKRNRKEDYNQGRSGESPSSVFICDLELLA